jgi:hypothetical protein
MGFFDSAAGITSSIGAANATFGAVSGAIGGAGQIVSNLGSAATALGNGDFLGAIRSANLPAAGELIGNVMAAASLFDSDDSNDWRVRLSMPTWPSFSSSPVLKPLQEVGGLVFPFTPTINIGSTAKYSAVSPTHNNFDFQAYENSTPSAITIVAPFYVEDAQQALYWIAAVHYLRSVTKMFAGRDSLAGNPPPLVMLNGYGNYVFKNVPVVVQSVAINLDAASDYIPTEVVGSALGQATGLADSIGGLAGSFGGLAGSLGGIGASIGSIANTVSGIASGVAGVTSLLGGFGVGGSVSGGQTYVPTKSSMSITLLPAYSRTTAKNFSLQQFVQGGYMSGKPGFI